MRIYEETQRFKQWWLYVLFVFILLGPFLKFYEQLMTEDYHNFDMFGLIFLGFIIIIGMILYMRLRTRIDNSGIEVVFTPLSFTRKKFHWKNIEKIYIRKYSPFEYGGWGIRSMGSKKAYNVAGNLGIQIVTTAGEKFLIGTQQPDAAKAVVKHYQNKINNRSKTF